MRSSTHLKTESSLLQIVSVIFIGLVASYFLMSSPHLPKIYSEDGILDLSDIYISEDPVKLKGEWEFYWQQLLTPNDIHERIAVEDRGKHFIEIPGSWSGYQLDEERLSGTGYATFRTVVQLSEQDRNERLALRLPTIFHSYKLWVNGDLLTTVGEVGTDQSSTKPNLATRLVFFQSQSDQVELVVQVANFHHRLGGITKYIELGGSDDLAVRNNLKIAAEMFVTASLLVIGIYHLLLYGFRRKYKSPLYFGLFSTLFGIRSLMVGEHLITQVSTNIPWELQFKLEYFTLCISSLLITMYYDSLYSNFVKSWVKRTSIIVTVILCSVVLFTPAIIYTKLLTVIGATVVIHCVYLMVGLALAARRRMEGSLLFLLVAVILLFAAINDFMFYNEWSKLENSFPIAMLVFTIAQMLLISSRFTRIAANEERISQELQLANDKLIEMNINLEQLVTERTNQLSKTNEELRISYDQLLHSEQGRKKLLAYITHDLRMPLSSMLGYVEAVQDGVKPERNEQYLQYIRDNTVRINRMIEELSFLSHLETGQITYQMEIVNATQFMQQFYEQYELVVRDAGLDFSLDIQQVEQLRFMYPIVLMDTKKMEQALFNIVSNAMKFTPKGGSVSISLATEELNAKRNVIIVISDSGIGIPPDQLEEVFNRNYRYFRPDVKIDIEGSGLGLAICREIIQAHNGIVRAESDGKTGSTFYITLPYISEEDRG